jgi:hypothetical protein
VQIFIKIKNHLRFNNVVVGLYAKGKAIKDTTGFVVDMV